MTVLSIAYTPIQLDLYIDQGDDFHRTIQVSSNGIPIDLSGFTFAAIVREYHNSNKTFPMAVSVDGNANLGRLGLIMTSVNTSLLEKSRYVYTVLGTSIAIPRVNIRVAFGQILVSHQ